ncbi:restriction endonuclease subunit S [Desulforamulus profundi]|uniref:Restriction endonuclease subunit S n=1 Tax=Desulforamulus profundi TaxID=1383067 RepID=A0A2C6MC43_9FIRM|nr:restriction endonuclease subunit S [Desulforamulus profundi]PHJ37608.1 restriction endonuclease subunit S [Desulforamulus profundi]
MSANQLSLHPLRRERLPKGWQLLPVGKVLVDSQYGTNTSASENGNTNVLGMKDIQNGSILTTNLICANLSKEERSKYILKKGDILINRTNSYDLVGKVGIFDSDDEVVFASYLVRLKVNEKLIIPEFLNYWLNSYSAQKTIKRIATRAVGQANINPTEFKKHCFVPVPPLFEQKEIVSLLKCCSSVIEKIEQLITAKEKQFTWLIKTLISGQCEQWEHLRAEELFDNVTEKHHPEEELLSVTQDRGVIPRRMLEGRVMSPEGSTSSYKLVQEGDFVISLRSFQGGIEYSRYRGIVSPAYTILRPKVVLHDEFYRHFFKSYIFIEKYLRIAVIGIRDGKQISIQDFLTIKIPYPSMEQQQIIAEVLNTAQQEINLLKRLADSYRKQKRGLMQKLLTGQWQVNTDKEAF